MSDLVERLRAVQAGDYDTHGTLRLGERTICDVPLIRDASDLAEMCQDAAAEIERLRAQIGAMRSPGPVMIVVPDTKAPGRKCVQVPLGDAGSR